MFHQFRHYILIAVLSLIVGIVIGSQIDSGELEEQKDFTFRVVNNCVNALEASRDISRSCSNAYQEAATCVTNINTCNISESRQKLEEYNSQKKEAEGRLKEAVDEADLILEDAKKFLN